MSRNNPGPPDDQLLDLDATERWARGGLSPEKLRAAGVPPTLMSDFEFFGCLFRDSQYDGHEGRPEIMGGYDRRGLLNVIAFLLADNPGPHPKEAVA